MNKLIKMELSKIEYRDILIARELSIEETNPYKSLQIIRDLLGVSLLCSKAILYDWHIVYQFKLTQ